jgi:hypothetical protein
VGQLHGDAAGFVRLAPQPAIGGAGTSPGAAMALLDQLLDHPGHQLRPDEQDIATSPALRSPLILGHRQVTEVYLLGLAMRQGSALVTLQGRRTPYPAPRCFSLKQRDPFTPHSALLARWGWGWALRPQGEMARRGWSCAAGRQPKACISTRGMTMHMNSISPARAKTAGRN